MCSLDDTLLTHDGHHVEKLASLDDSAQQCSVWAHHLVKLHDGDDQTDDPLDFCLWEPTDLETIETGLTGAGMTIRPSKVGLKAHAPQQWRHYVLGLWRRHQHKPDVATLYQSKWRIAQQLLSEFVNAHPHNTWPVPCDHWYTQPAFGRFVEKTLQVP